MVKHKGDKKFRHKREQVFQATGLFDLSNLKFEKAISEYQRLSFKSSYGTFFGRQPGVTDFKDINILNFKKFSDLECSKVLNKSAIVYLDKWQSNEEENDYVGMALYTLKSLNTYFKNYKPVTSTNRDLHKIFAK